MEMNSPMNDEEQPQSKTLLYAVWSNMKQRCNNPNSTHYKYYGGRGIKVCERWMTFKNFYDDMSPRPEGLTLDRTNPDGNYEPDNCRWVTRSVQAYNKRMRNKNGYLGISKHRNMWQASISHKHKDIYLGLFKTKEEAALAYQDKAKELYGDLYVDHFNLRENPREQYQLREIIVSILWGKNYSDLLEAERICVDELTSHLSRRDQQIALEATNEIIGELHRNGYHKAADHAKVYQLATLKQAQENSNE
jgi:hypothetical protein